MNLQLRLLKSNKHKKRVQKSKFRKMQAKLYELWDKRRAKDLSPMQLLRACSYLYGPVVN